MKAKVLERFRDKYTGVVYGVGDVITVTKDRLEEIINTNPALVKVTEDAQTADKTNGEEIPTEVKEDAEKGAQKRRRRTVKK